MNTPYRKNGMNSMRPKTQPTGTCVIGLKQTTKNVYSKRAGKNVDVVETKGSFNSTNGTGFSVKLSKTSDAKFKETGVAYWLEIAEFGQSDNRR